MDKKRIEWKESFKAEEPKTQLTSLNIWKRSFSSKTIVSIDKLGPAFEQPRILT